MGFARFLETCKAAETLLLLAAGQDTAAAHTIACHILTTANAAALLLRLLPHGRLEKMKSENRVSPNNSKPRFWGFAANYFSFIALMR